MDANYEPGGHLTSVTLAGGTLTELRGFDQRYFPTSIDLTAAAPLLDWTYGTDPVGNVTTITDGITPANSRTYTYEPFFEYLTHASGPWGTIDWTHDGIGNRLTEERPPLPLETYQYETNGAAGNSPLLEQVTISGDGTRDYGYDPAGNQTSATAGANEVELTYDLFGRLAEITRPAAGATTGFVYDARGYLARAVTATIFTDGFESGDVSCWSSVEGGDPPAGTCPAPPAEPESVVHPTYSSEGHLHSLARTPTSGGTTTEHYVFYLGGSPVATLDKDGAARSFMYLLTDHLGTPILATDATGTVAWEGGFEPFGRHWKKGTGQGAHENGVFLRLPGQWFDEVWEDASSLVDPYYNVHRWYSTGTARYTRPDP